MFEKLLRAGEPSWRDHSRQPRLPVLSSLLTSPVSYFHFLFSSFLFTFFYVCLFGESIRKLRLCSYVESSSSRCLLSLFFIIFDTEDTVWFWLGVVSIFMRKSDFCHVDIWVKVFAKLSEYDFKMFGLSQFSLSWLLRNDFQSFFLHVLNLVVRWMLMHVSWENSQV